MAPLIIAALKLAPYILPEAVRALSGDKAAEAAERVIQAAKVVTGADSPEDAAEAVLRDPAAQLKLQELLSAERLEFARLAVKEQEIAAADRDSARGREKEVKDNTPRNLAYLIVAAFIGMCYAVLFDTAKVDSVLAGTIIGYLSAKTEQAFSYYFGTTSGSKQKTELLAKADAVKE